MSEDRADRVRERRRNRRSPDREDSQTTETDDVDQASETSQTHQTSQMDESDQSNEANQTPVREQTHVAMYLDDDLAEQLDLRFDELALQYRREHGEKLTKNGEFYPALARAAINDSTVREELGLADDESASEDV